MTTVRIAFDTRMKVLTRDLDPGTTVYEPGTVGTPVPGLPPADTHPWFTFYTRVSGLLTPWAGRGQPATMDPRTVQRTASGVIEAVRGQLIPPYTPKVAVPLGEVPFGQCVLAPDGTMHPGETGSGDPVYRWGYITGDGTSYLLPCGARVPPSAISYALDPLGDSRVRPWLAEPLQQFAHGKKMIFPICGFGEDPAPFSTRATGSGVYAVEVDGQWFVAVP